MLVCLLFQILTNENTLYSSVLFVHLPAPLNTLLVRLVFRYRVTITVLPQNIRCELTKKCLPPCCLCVCMCVEMVCTLPAYTKAAAAAYVDQQAVAYRPAFRTRNHIPPIARSQQPTATKKAAESEFLSPTFPSTTGWPQNWPFLGPRHWVDLEIFVYRNSVPVAYHGRGKDFPAAECCPNFASPIIGKQRHLQSDKSECDTVWDKQRDRPPVGSGFEVLKNNFIILSGSPDVLCLRNECFTVFSGFGGRRTCFICIRLGGGRSFIG